MTVAATSSARPPASSPKIDLRAHAKPWASFTLATAHWSPPTASRSASPSPARSRAAAIPHISVILKPTDPDQVVAQLLRQIGEALGRGPGDRALRGGDAGRAQRIPKVAGALFDQFGAQAVVLARRQAEGATGDVLTTWTEIIADLTGRRPDGGDATSPA